MRRVGWVLASIAVSLAAPVEAQPSRLAQSSGASNRASGDEHAGSLQSRLALAVAERLLSSDDPEERLRGVERLAGSAQREGIDRLVRALGDSTAALRDPRARLAAIRGIAPFAARESVREALAAAVSGEPGGAPLMSLVRDTAALGLAMSEDSHSLERLGALLRQGGPGADSVERALVAYPPISLVPLIGREDLSPGMSDLLGRLGDQRAVATLRATLVRSLVRREGADGEALPEDEVRRARVAAAMALARLGDQEQVAVARGWLASGDAWLKLRAAEILLLGGAPDARVQLVSLLSAPLTRAAAFRLAARSPGVELLAPLLDAAGGSEGDARTATILLGRIGGASPVAKLEKLLSDPSRRWDAAFALARAPGAEARRALERADDNPSLARLAARAGIVRALALRDEPHGLVTVLRALLASRDAADRAAGAFGLAALGKTPLDELLASPDGPIVRAASRATLVLGGRAWWSCGARLARETDPITRSALAIALAGPDDALAALPTYKLVQWAESGRAFAPLALRALGAREQPGDEGRIGRWLGNDDPVYRAHAALALAESPVASAVSRLRRAWLFEPDAAVRRAIVTALAARREPQREAALAFVTRFEPDPAARESALLALKGRLPQPEARLGAGCAGSEHAVGVCHVAWIALAPSDGAPPQTVEAREGSLLDFSGLSLPLVSDPDGALVVAGLSAPNASFRLASEAIWYEASDHVGSETGPAP